MLKDSPANSGEPNLDRLLDRFMRAAIDHSGAERALLIAYRGDALQIQAQAAAGSRQVTVNLAVGGCLEAPLPQSLLRHVLQTRQTVNLGDATAPNPFSADPYLFGNRIHSVLCLPLINDGVLAGMLYFENNRSPGGFGPACKAILELLESQAAMCLENARLYRDVAFDSREHKRAEQALRRSESGALIEFFGTAVDVNERRHAEQRLLVQYRVTRILADVATVEEATPKILRALGESLGWNLGALWRVDPKSQVLGCAESWCTPCEEAAQFEAVVRTGVFRRGSGLPGRVWETHIPEFIPDAGQDVAFRRMGFASRQVSRAAIAFPILSGREVIGVVGFISHEVAPPDQELLVVLANIGSQIGQFVKRTAAVEELRLRVSMLQNIPVAAWSVMPDGTPDIVNELWYEFTGQTSEHVHSHPDAWMSTIHAEDRDRASRIYWDGIRTGRGFTMEARFLRARDGAYRWHLNRAVPVRDPQGNLLRIVGTSTDVHDWRQAQEALRNTHAEFVHMTRVMTMGELTASIAHEVNQPLGAIVTSAAAGARWLTTNPPQMTKARRAFDRIANDGRRAAEVIRRIRALMKRQAPRKEWLDINETIREVLALSQYQLRRSEVLVETRLSPEVRFIRGDKVQLQQVLLNLILNAIEAMNGVKERPRQLTIVSIQHEPATVSVQVHDTGTGLDPVHAPHLFEPFYTTKLEGLGIGLSISRSILEAHGGQLSAEANTPCGTIFRFSLPVDEPAH